MYRPKPSCRMSSGQELLLIVLTTAFCLEFVSGQLSVNCFVTTVMVPNSNIRGGVFNQNATNVSSCEAICAGSISCYGFDWDRNENRCYLTEDVKATIFFNNSQGVDHYILMKNTSNCFASCSYSVWTPIVNMHTSGAVGRSVSGLDECVSLCILNPSCQSIDWDPDNADQMNCWMQSEASSNLAPASKIYHYDKNCSVISGSTTGNLASTTSLPTFPRTSTTLPLPLQTITTTSTKTVSPSSKSTSLAQSTKTLPTVLITTGSTTLGSVQISTLSVIGNKNSTSPTIMSDATTRNSSSSNTSSSYTNSNETVSGKPSHYGDNDEKDSGVDDDYLLWAIKPAYVVLAGVGGGCLLLVLTAVVILCEYPLNSEKDPIYPHSYDSKTPSDIVDMSFFGDHQTDFPLYGVIADEFVSTPPRQSV